MFRKIAISIIGAMTFSGVIFADCDELTSAIERWQQEAQRWRDQSDQYGSACKSATRPIYSGAPCGLAKGAINKSGQFLHLASIGRLFLKQGECDLGAVKQEYIEREEKIKTCVAERINQNRANGFAAVPTIVKVDCEISVYDLLNDNNRR
jgi:hypothetical protein